MPTAHRVIVYTDKYLLYCSSRPFCMYSQYGAAQFVPMYVARHIDQLADLS